MKYPNLRQTAVASLVALTLGMTACSSNDDDGGVLGDVTDGVDGAVDGVTDGVDGAVDGVTDGVDGAVDGVTDGVDGAVDGATDGVDGAVDGVTGGDAGEDGDAGAGEDGDAGAGEDGDAGAGEDGDAGAGEDGDAGAGGDGDAGAGGDTAATPFDSTVGSFTIRLTNTSESQPMTPPIVVLHNAPTADNGIRLFEVTQPAIGQVIAIAEDGNNTPMVETVMGQIGNTIAAGGPAFVDPAAPGPVLPGQTASITLESTEENQVLSIVSMVVCTNDGFSGIDSRTLAAETFTAPIYDAGSEVNELMLNFWVPPCNGGTSDNLGNPENGAIQLHEGQFESENRIYDFEAGTEYLEITVTRN